MPRIGGDRLHRIEVEGLPVEDVAGEAFLQHVDQVLGRTAAHEAGLDAGLLHHAREVVDEGQRDAACSSLEGEAVAHDAAVAQKSRDEIRDAQAVGAARDLRGAADDLRRIADGFDFDDVVHVVALDLPGNAGKRNQVVGHHDHAVGIDRVGQREAQRAAGRLAVRAVSVAEEVGGRRGDHRNVDVYFAVLHCLPASAVRAQHAHAAHLAVRTVVAQRAVHAAFDVMYRAGLHQLDHRLVTGKRSAGKPHQVSCAHARGSLQRGEGDAVAIAQVMMAADGHAIAQAAEPQRGLEVRHALVAVAGIVAVGANRRAVLVAGGAMAVDAGVGQFARVR